MDVVQQVLLLLANNKQEGGREIKIRELKIWRKWGNLITHIQVFHQIVQKGWNVKDTLNHQ